jgi:hypothetical protein
VLQTRQNVQLATTWCMLTVCEFVLTKKKDDCWQMVAERDAVHGIALAIR